MAYTTTTTRTSTVAATESRVRAVLRQVNVDFLAAVGAGLVDRARVSDWRDDLSFMLLKDALEYFEFRVLRDGHIVSAWRYVVATDGNVYPSDRGGGINFYAFVAASAEVRLVIKRRPGLAKNVADEIDRRGWTRPAANLSGALTQERTYSKDGYGVVRHRISLG